MCVHTVTDRLVWASQKYVCLLSMFFVTSDYWCSKSMREWLRTAL